MIALALVAALSASSALHFYWSVGGTLFKDAALPHVDGKKVWSPAPLTTTFVAVGLLLSAGFAAVAAGFIESPIPPVATSWVCYFLGAIFIWRAIGDFRYVGFFKRVGDPPFSRLDYWLYSPAITLMGLGFFYLA